MSRRHAAAALLASLFALAPAVAHAWVPLDPSQPHWGNLPVTYKINQSTIPSSISAIAVSRVDAAFASWGAPGCTNFATIDGGNTSLSYNYQDGTNVIRWISQSWPSQLGDVSSVIGVTMPVWDNGGIIFDADIVFNDVGFDWNDTGSAGHVDTQSIATHEEGHFLGLDHTNAQGATMEAYYGGGTSLRSLEQDDINGVCTLYPADGSSVSTGTTTGGGGDCNTCASDAQNGACAGATQACGQQQDCVDFYNCYQNCSTQTCVDNCVNAHPTGAQTYSSLVDCVCQTCSSACSAQCGGSSGSTTSTGSGASGPTGTTTGSGTGAGSTTGAGVGGAGAGSGVGGASTASGWGNDEDDDPPALRDPGESSGCAVDAPGSDAPLGAAGLLAALGLVAVRRRKRR
jgi:MYXO-CTERM domain-containing protein